MSNTSRGEILTLDDIFISVTNCPHIPTVIQLIERYLQHTILGTKIPDVDDSDYLIAWRCGHPCHEMFNSICFSFYFI